MTPFVCLFRLLLTGLAAAASVLAAEFPAADLSALQGALARVQPGDTVVLADGAWRDATIEIARGGTPTAPVILRARTPGKVVLGGTSTLTLAAPYVVVDGLVFSGCIPPAKKNVIDFSSDHDRVTNVAIVDCNPPAAAAPADESKRPGYYYVYFKGNDNRLDHSTLSGKNNPQPVIGNHINGSRRNTVEACHFKDIAYVGQNGREIFRIWGYGGNEELGPDGAFFTIADNLFTHAHGEGQEIISLKSNRNVIRNNTIRGSRGGITNRSGNYNTIEGNFIFGDGQAGTYGLRITGQYHRILHNYIEGVSSFGINVMCGELFLEALTDKFAPILRDNTVHGRVPAYNQPRNTTVAYNTLVDNAGPDLVIGSDYKSGWPARQRVLLPEFCHVANNLIRKSGDAVALSITAPDRKTPELAKLTFAGNTYADNLASGGTVKADTALAAGAFKAEPTLTFVRDAAGALRPTDVTLAQSSAAATPSVFSKEPSPFRPLTPQDVGPSWTK
jgi:poly(beta-D-mannuronate) lyase